MLLELEGPCYSCILNNRLKSSICDVANCSRMASWLLDLASRVLCPKCSSGKVVKHGLYKHRNVKRQKYRCKNCGCAFVPRKGLVQKRF